MTKMSYALCTAIILMGATALFAQTQHNISTRPAPTSRRQRPPPAPPATPAKQRRVVTALHGGNRVMRGPANYRWTPLNASAPFLTAKGTEQPGTPAAPALSQPATPVAPAPLNGSNPEVENGSLPQPQIIPIPI